MSIVASPKNLTSQVATILTQNLDPNQVPIHPPLFLSQLGPSTTHAPIGHAFVSPPYYDIDTIAYGFSCS